MMRCIKGAYGSVTVYADRMVTDRENVIVLSVEGDRSATIELKLHEVDELTKVLQNTKEVLARGRNTNE